MITAFLTAIVAPLALQASATAASQSPITSLDQLPIEEATSARCAVAFAIVGQWQRSGDPRGSDYPDMASGGGREFFVRAIATLMESRGLSREAVNTVIGAEVRALSSPEGAQRFSSMMPACLLMKQAAGL